MPGTAGSKYGVLNDGIPLRKGKDAGSESRDELQPELKDLRPLIKSRAKRRATGQPAAS